MELRAVVLPLGAIGSLGTGAGAQRWWTAESELPGPLPQASATSGSLSMLTIPGSAVPVTFSLALPATSWGEGRGK